MLKVEREGDKVVITYTNEDNSIEPVSIVEVVDAKEFDECVKKYKDMGAEDPYMTASAQYALYGDCGF
jgi:hypothetical protein